MTNAPLVLAAAALLAASGAAEAKRRPFPTYEHAVRCAGLTGAWMREVPEWSKEGISRFDKALFWGLAASEMAQRGKLPAGRMEEDTQAAVAKAQAELSGGGAAAEAARRELAGCVSEVPPTGKAKRR